MEIREMIRDGNLLTIYKIFLSSIFVQQCLPNFSVALALCSVFT